MTSYRFIISHAAISYSVAWNRFPPIDYSLSLHTLNSGIIIKLIVNDIKCIIPNTEVSFTLPSTPVHMHLDYTLIWALVD